MIPGTGYPAHWLRGQHLNVQGFQDGSYRVSLLGQPWVRERDLEFDSSFDCNRFIAWWYSHEGVDPRAR